MKNVSLTLLITGLFMCSGILYSQEKKAIHRTSQSSPTGVYRCLSDEYNAGLLKKYPAMMGSKTFEDKLKNLKKNRSSLRLQTSMGVTLVRIPVVVHVIHNGTAIGVDANISDDQVFSQIQVLNEDYRKMSGTRGENSNSVGADTNIEFYLAKEDPDCNPTTGIDRQDLSSFATEWESPDVTNSNTQTIMKPMTIWDPSRYLNLWTVTFDPVSASDLLGYAQFPGGPPNTDGVVMGYQYFGSDDDPNVDLSGSVPYHLGRTTTHEIGHFLGLYHTFEGGCSPPGDECDDTPPVEAANYSCPAGADSCPKGAGDGILDMIENYMDYTDDSCMNVFTNDQSARMDAVLSDPRLSLSNSTVPDTPLPSVSYDGSIKIVDLNLDLCAGFYTPIVRLANYGTEVLTSATLTYDINNGTPEILNWTGSLAKGEFEIINLSSMSISLGNNNLNIMVSQTNTDQRTCNDTDTEAFIGATYESTTQVQLTLKTDGFASETSWEFKDSSDTVLYSENYNPSSSNKTFNYAFDVSPNECYTFTISDSFGDGLCCAQNNGEGFYELRTNNNSVIIYSSGDFGFSESTVISTTTLSVGNYFMSNDVSLYPNPTSSDLTIKVRTINDLPNSFQIFNLLGQKVLTKKITNTEDLKIQTSHFGKGMYFINIIKDNTSITIPFIKK